MTEPLGVVTLGGFDLVEPWPVSQSGDGLSLAADETAPHPSTVGYVRATHHNLSQVGGRTLSVVFSGKTHLTGFYRAGEASSELTERGDMAQAKWGLSLERIGDSPDVEVESDVPTISRATDHAGLTPVYWHAPAVGYTSYVTGTSNPSSSVSRSSADGSVTAHLGVPVGESPRWTIGAASYLLGSARLLLDGFRRIGERTPPHSSWQVDNALVRLKGAANGAFEVACWAGSWESAGSWQLTVNGSAVTSTPELTVLRNDPEEVMVRLTYPTLPTGRVTVDLGLRRGSRFLTGVMKRHTSATLGIKRVVAAAGTAETGRVRQTANDADGNRYVVGSAKSYTADTASGGLSKASVTYLDFFLGHAVGGSSAVAGDTPADLVSQYLGSTGEQAEVVRQ